ncbi:hypothetical protein RI129_013077 [Pyrocoelia pectoralis]|uniref:Nuclear pore complex protein Nup98-Nup96 n=1 Tax=Pyrocoelia pectoralis TaxID=417401 RepID=A0AAN7ZCW4_9COLE
MLRNIPASCDIASMKINSQYNSTATCMESIGGGIAMSANEIDKKSNLLRVNKYINNNHLSCGVKLTRPEYYTVPPLNELYKYKNDRGECVIKGFIVGRLGFGEVCFRDPVDVANLNLDEIVLFRRGEIILYGDDGTAPSIGEGLNRSARVTLERLWPRDQAICDISFEDKLRFLTEKQNATFLHYYPDTGTCVFAVDHFSKYSYKDSDGDCEIVTNDTDKEILDQIGELEELQHARRGLGGIISSEKSPFVSSSLVINPPHFADVSSFINEPKPLYIVRSSFFDEDSISDDMSSCDVGVHLSVQNSSTCTSNASDRMNLNPPNPLIKRYTLLSRVKEPVTHKINDMFNCHGVLADMTLFKSRSFKVGWGPGLKMVTLSSKSNGANLIGEPRCVDIVDVATDVLGKPKAMELEGHLNVVLNSCTFTTSKSGLPSCTVQTGMETLVQHQIIAKRLLEVSLHSSLVKYYSQTWDLCWSLWGPEAITSTAKRELFSTWLQTIARSENVDVVPLTNKQDMILVQIFVHLLSHQVYEACQLAMDNDMPSLSILIAQTQQSTRQHIATQIEQWQDRGSINFITAHIKKIYALLGGLPLISDTNVLDGLKWKRILALYLWYICPPGLLLDEAVKEYTDAFEKMNIANYPAVEHKASISELTYDTQYHILQLNHNPQDLLNKVLDPAGHTPYICDYRFSWLLLQVLTSLKVGSLPTSIHDVIHIRFATQLEAMGMWKWAAFVVLFIKESRLKFSQLFSLLERNLTVDDNTEVIKFLENKLKIPPFVIHAVLAQKTESAGDFIVSFKHYLLSRNWWKAHNVLIEHVVPDLILREDFALLLRFIEELFLETTKSPQSVPAGLVYEYLQLHERVASIPEEEMTEGDEFSHTRRTLLPPTVALISRLKHFPAVESRQLLAKLELSRHLKHMLDIVSYGCDDPTVTSSYKELALPFDYEYTMSMWKS